MALCDDFMPSLTVREFWISISICKIMGKSTATSFVDSEWQMAWFFVLLNNSISKLRSVKANVLVRQKCTVSNEPFGWKVKLNAGPEWWTALELNTTNILFPATSMTRLGLWLDENRPIRGSVVFTPSRSSMYSPDRSWKVRKRSWTGLCDAT